MVYILGTKTVWIWKLSYLAKALPDENITCIIPKKERFGSHGEKKKQAFLWRIWKFRDLARAVSR